MIVTKQQKTKSGTTDFVKQQDREKDSGKQQIFESEVMIMRKFADYFRENQVEILMALYSMNMSTNSFQGYEMTQVLSER